MEPPLLYYSLVSLPSKLQTKAFNKLNPPLISRSLLPTTCYLLRDPTSLAGSSLCCVLSFWGIVLFNFSLVFSVVPGMGMISTAPTISRPRIKRERILSQNSNSSRSSSSRSLILSPLPDLASINRQILHSLHEENKHTDNSGGTESQVSLVSLFAQAFRR
jgi:hypothetical protein